MARLAHAKRIDAAEYYIEPAIRQERSSEYRPA